MTKSIQDSFIWQIIWYLHDCHILKTFNFSSGHSRCFFMVSVGKVMIGFISCNDLNGIGIHHNLPYKSSSYASKPTVFVLFNVFKKFTIAVIVAGKFFFKHCWCHVRCYN